MKSKFMLVALVVTSTSVGLAQNAGPIAPSAPASCSAVTGDAHQKILNILTCGRSYRLLIQIQGQIANLAAAGVDQSQITTLRAAVEGMASEYSQLADASAQIEQSIGVVNSKLDGVSQGVGIVSNNVSTVNSEVIADAQSRITDDIEAQLESGKMEASLYIRQSQGGRLEMVRDLVSSRASEAESSGWQTDEIKHYLALGNKDLVKGNDHGALSNYRKAYMHIIGKLGHKVAPKSWFLSTFHN